MFPLIPLIVEGAVSVGALYTGAKAAKAIIKLGKYSAKKKNINKYRKNDLIENVASNYLDTANIGTSIANNSRLSLGQAVTNLSKARSHTKPLEVPITTINVSPMSGGSLIEIIKNGSDSTNSVLAQTSENLVNTLNGGNVMLNNIAMQLETGNLIQSAVLPEIYSAISILGISLSEISSALNNISSKLSSPLQDDFYRLFNDVNEFKTTRGQFTDSFGNDAVNLSPQEIKVKRDIGQGISHGLENDTKLEDVNFDDILPDLDMSNFSDDALKIFNFNGVMDNLEKIVTDDIAHPDGSTIFDKNSVQLKGI